MSTGPHPPLVLEARSYLGLLERENLPDLSVDQRLRAIEAEIAATGTYSQTFEELSHGAKLAWRNSIRCVGRKYWPSLTIHDRRDLRTCDEVFDALVEHLRWSTNHGKIRPLITVLAPADAEGSGIRIWNEQLIRYAGYRQPDGSILGDPQQVEMTEVLHHLGWRKEERTRFDLLPLVIQMPGERPQVYEVPGDAVLEVEITHPAHAWFAELGLRWHALPAISGMLLDVGGIRYTAAPFSGWYMLTEVGARNFADEGRYNILPEIARGLGLSTSSNRNLWKDRALVELNVAVYHSFEEAGVKMIDHHTATRHFVEFEECEARHGRAAYAEWSWIVPPVSGSTTQVFHRRYEGVELKPNFFPQQLAWRDGLSAACPHLRQVPSARPANGPARRAPPAAWPAISPG